MRPWSHAIAAQAVNAKPVIKINNLYRYFVAHRTACTAYTCGAFLNGSITRQHRRASAFAKVRRCYFFQGWQNYIHRFTYRALAIAAAIARLSSFSIRFAAIVCARSM